MGIYIGKNSMMIVTKEDKKYPKLLKQIGKDAPTQLYCKGVFDEKLFEKCLAVVGSRHMTSYGKRAVEQLVGEVAASGITIVSGFMYGIDATAHQAALTFSGRTIAVMPCGIELVHPEYQKDLYANIIEQKGLILSEYEGKFLPSNWTYPRRNRIVAALCQAVLVVEAGEKSGSLITANFAKKFKRKIFAVPGPLTSEVSKGTNELIRQGAELVGDARHILKFFGIEKGKRMESVNTTESALEKRIVAVLQREPMETDILARTLDIPASQVGATLSVLELGGFITQDRGKYYVN